MELAWNNEGRFGVARGLATSLDRVPETTKPLALQGVSMERVTGIEPALSAWEADVLPLNYTRERTDYASTRR